MCYTFVEFVEVKSFIVSVYKDSRLYGRNKQNGWWNDYGDSVVKQYVECLNRPSYAEGKAVLSTTLISRWEAKSGEAIHVTVQDVINHHYSQMSKVELVQALGNLERLQTQLTASRCKRELAGKLRLALLVIDLRRSVIQANLAGTYGTDTLQ